MMYMALQILQSYSKYHLVQYIENTDHIFLNPYPAGTESD